jgi:putative hydrolase of the HAD superfamily
MNRTLVFDNDGTLYKIPAKFEKYVVRLIIKYLSKKLGFSERKIKKLRSQLKKKYSTQSTFFAFRSEFEINEKDFLKHTFLAVNPGDFLQKDKKLIEILSKLEGKKIVLTNNPSEFAKRILKTLGVEDFFDFVIGESEIKYKHKPNEEPFNIVSKKCRGKKIMIDDNLRNLLTAKKLGFETIHVGNFVIGSDYNINNIYEIGRVLK